jgi:hypothetical protein
MGKSDVSLAAVEEFIAVKHKKLAFPAWLEQQYELDTRLRRSQRLRSATLANAIVYNLFLIADWFLVPDQFWLAVTLHALVVTPWILLAGWVARPNSSRWLREGATASVPIAIVLQILCDFVRTTSPDAGHYQYFVLLVMLLTNTIQRLPYHFAAAVSALIVLLQGTALTMSGHGGGYRDHDTRGVSLPDAH